MAKKTYTIKYTPMHGEPRNCTGTLEELTEYFSYELIAGNSWNPTINPAPKTFVSLLKNLDKASRELHHGYNRPYYSKVA